VASNPYRYSGYIFDEETGLYYLKARYYDPETARFLSEDTYLGQAGDPLSLNLYAYVKYNPLKYYDPTGHYVSETDRANLSADQIALLEKLTKGWEAAYARGDTAGMKIANDAANAVRNSANYSGGSNGNSISVDFGNTVKTITVDKATTVTNNGTITNLNVNKGVTTSITNNGTITTLNNSGTITTIDNTGKINTIINNGSIETINNYGSINTIVNNADIGYIKNNVDIGTISNNGHVNAINNSGNINTIYNTGTVKNINITETGSVKTITNDGGNIGNIHVKPNDVTINNSGQINQVTIGVSSVATINNTGLINDILIGANGTLAGTNSGYVVNISAGKGGKSTDNWTKTSQDPALLIQNQFILNYFLTQKEQNVGVGVSRIGGILYRDISTPVTNALERDVWEFEENSGKNKWFAAKVGNKGLWNLKYRESDGNHWEDTLGIPFWGYSTQMSLNGMLVTVEQVGNITYGYLGTAAGMSQSWMDFGSSVNHFLKHGFTNWDNEDADKSLFILGINWYNTGVMK